MQLTRLVQVDCPLGPDVLLLQRMEGREELGRLFAYELHLVSENPNLPLEQLLGKPMSLSLELPSGSRRFFHGIVARCSQVAGHGQFAGYQATLRPWPWLLTRTSDCRIFQNQSVPEIIKQVFRDLGFSDFEDALTRPYREWEYCVQYRETSFDFISRLMEQEGIYYWFRHEQKRHILVLSDAYGAHRSPGGYASVPYYPPTLGHRERDHFFDWQMAREVQPGSLTLNDYDFQRPGARLEVRSNIARPHAAADYPLYDYPGEYVQSQDGEQYARNRIEAIQAQHERVRLRGVVRGIGAGHLFRLSGYPRDDQNREYLVVGAEYRVVQELYETGSGGAGSQFESELDCIDASQSFRLLPQTPVPVVRGPQTAVVVGPKGEEIWTEIVSFLEGDPDRPIITGRVYNAEQTVPYELPANATQSGMKSRSSKGGTPANFNEIRMEDKKGAEQLYIHAERNQDNLVENDASLSVGHDRNKSIGHDELARIGNNRTRAVKLNDTLLVGGAKSDSVTGTYLIEAGAQIRLVCGKSVVEFNADGTINISGSAFNLYASGNGNIDTGGRLDLNSGGASEVDAKGKGVQGTIDGQVQAMFPPPAKG
ncbi:MAG: type VI secretion system tip protein TssI/VgrG [Pseudomonas aeruginosa]|nr:type VI secretion system tip protein TssI/VgrG [Pseudomonas aeruginosa]